MFIKTQLLFSFTLSLFRVSYSEFTIIDVEPYHQNYSWDKSFLNTEGEGTVYLSAPVRLIDHQLSNKGRISKKDRWIPIQIGGYPGVPVVCYYCNVFWGHGGYYPSGDVNEDPNCRPNLASCNKREDCCWKASACVRGHCIGCLLVGEGLPKDPNGCKIDKDCCGTGECGQGKAYYKALCHNPKEKCNHRGEGCYFNRNSCCSGLTCAARPVGNVGVSGRYSCG